jgi:uncharacterized phage protein (TIGR01671 family)
MKREIKFRAWHKKKRKMLRAFPRFNQFVEVIGLGVQRMVESKEIELMQYTGLKDKNGKEIYEGDIVKLKQNTIWQVAWNEDKLKWHMWSIDSTNSINITRKSAYYDKYEVIGNTYESSELLKND